jgi:ATP-dependent DNA helicase RecG
MDGFFHGQLDAPFTLTLMDVAPSRIESSLATRLERLPGVGTTRAEKLAKLGLVTVRDALMHFPRDYKDFSGAHSVACFQEGDHASVAGMVTDIASRTSFAGRTILTVTIDAGDERVRGVWFNMPFMARRFERGMRVVLAGVPRRGRGGWEFAHPEVRWLAGDEAAHGSEWLAIYPLAEGVQQSHVRMAVQAALDHAAGICPEAFPEAMLTNKGLLPIEKALQEIHRPSSQAMIDAARRRLVYQELFMLQLALRMHRGQQKRSHAAPSIAVDARLDARIRARFPFEFTAAQRRVCDEIAADLAKHEPMNRLLQGDVGSGKTAVAVYAMLAAVATPVVGTVALRDDAASKPARYQAAIMAPTELLARQHFASLCRLLAGSGVAVELLVGGQTARERGKAVARIAAGEADIVVGTQALVGGSATFRNLGLVVIDEQHRFGVLQRAVLQQASAEPHTLVMTATPIPRTIAHAVYGDLDVSTLDEQPPGRQPVATYRVTPDELDRWWEFFRKKVVAGRRGYVVVPAVEESKRDLATIASTFEHLAHGPLEAFRLGLVHGRLKPAAKAGIMEDFRAGKLDVLVATSVIEVGIDVPEATIMTILDAESFGLAQLHQLRGRVARGPTRGICGAVTGSGTEPHPRVDAFVATCNGFELAEKDLVLRGPGDLVGTRQSGAPPLYLADLLRDGAVVAEARRDALAVFEQDPDLVDPKYDRLRKLVIDRWGEMLGLGQVG